MSTVLMHPEGKLEIEELPSGKKRLTVVPVDKDLYVALYTWDTEYPVELIEEIFRIKGVGMVLGEIMREEDPFRREGLRLDLLSYVSEERFNNGRILDFGCGSGSSTVNLARLFPNAEIVGVDMVPEVLAIGESRAKWYGFDKVKFVASPDPDTLPEGLGKFDFLTLIALFEHLLPNERSSLLPRVWSLLKPGGTLFLRGTPYRYSPIDSHTTGLPLINYLPDKATLFVVRKFSDYPAKTWDELLREGIRGGTESEIMNILKGTPEKPILLEPREMGMKDRIDVWKATKKGAKGVLLSAALKVFKRITGITMLPYLALAIQKELDSSGSRN